MNLDVIDPTFVDDLAVSDKAVWAIANWLRRSGYEVQLPPIRVRDRWENRAAFRDNGDMLVRREGADAWTRVECKQRRELDFQSKVGFPYPTIIVDVADKWDGANPKPQFYVIANKSLTAALLVPGSSSTTWTRKTGFDRHANRDRTWYYCALEHTKFVRLTVEDKSGQQH